jgi:cellulose synthase/poly-beta-1,6-N-acetylglucosamine synthase-like glycosyltransferase
MNWTEISTQVLFWLAIYFTCINCFYAILCLISFRSISTFSPLRSDAHLPAVFSEFLPPVSLIVPAYNEASIIATTLRSLLQLEYGTFEVVCVNDGSTDNSLEVLKERFDLEAITQGPRCEIPCTTVRGIYRSRKYANLRVIDKANGGKADALNAGIRFSNYEHVCCIDADSILQRDSLAGIVKPFLDDPTTVAVGGTVRIANGCEVKDGHILRRGLPSSFMAKLQTLEYLRAFLFGSIGWAQMNALLVISGAFGLFKRQTLVDIGGYRTSTVGEDMELILRIHRYHRLNKIPYRVHFMADPVCWTEAPEDLKTLKNQRVRWHRGLAEGLSQNMELFFNKKAGFVGFFAFPFFLFFELLGPVVWLFGIAFLVVSLIEGWAQPDVVLALTAMTLASGIFLSTMGILLEEVFFHVQKRLRDFWWLFACAIVENFGYRELNSVFQVAGISSWAFRRKNTGDWGQMTRNAQWTVKQ